MIIWQTKWGFENRRNTLDSFLAASHRQLDKIIEQASKQGKICLSIPHDLSTAQPTLAKSGSKFQKSLLVEIQSFSGTVENFKVLQLPS